MGRERVEKCKKFLESNFHCLKNARACAIISLQNKKSEREKRKMKFLTDMHTHSTYSHDGRSDLKTMLSCAQKQGLAFYGVSEHFDYDYVLTNFSKQEREKMEGFNPDAYFHDGRHLQEDYAGVMNVIIGAEFGYSDDLAVQRRYQETVKKYAPDYVINSVHGIDGTDYYYCKTGADKTTAYGEYLSLIRRSLDAPYPYDIVGHIGYVARYALFEDKSFDLTTFGAQIDDILQTIIKKGKILEVNSANKQLLQRTLPSENIIKRYFELGGRKVSFGSDAHDTLRIADKRAEVVEMLKGIGFTYLIVPCRGEHIKVEI